MKEKFGGLRFYADSRSEDADVSAGVEDLISEAERRSGTVCERCGAPGALAKRHGWFKTVCTACADGMGYSALPD